MRIDERVAGFTALGIGRETHEPAAVVCTSGTAVANLLPAALEAHHAGVPLLLLTADRPPELRGVGANQTTRQPGMFAPTLRYEADLHVPDATDDAGDAEQSLMLRRVADEAFAAALGAGTWSPGPVHLNLPYREPLAGELPRWFGAPGIELSATPDDDPDAPPADLPPEDEAVRRAVPGRRRHRRVRHPSRTRRRSPPHRQGAAHDRHRGRRRRTCRGRAGARRGLAAGG